MKNKMQSKKSKPSERTIKKKQEKKKSKELKKRMVSVAKSLKNEKVKGGKAVPEEEEEEEKPDIKEDVKAALKPEKIFNEGGKIVFSKFEFAARPSQAKKSKKDSKSKLASMNLPVTQPHFRFQNKSETQNSFCRN